MGLSKCCVRRTCYPRATCAGIQAGKNDEPDWHERNCMCDADCPRFGDCCADSALFEVAEQRRATSALSCVELRRYGGVYMLATCPPAWEDADGRRRCEDPDVAADPVGAGMPVSDSQTLLTYRNAHCARCHGALTPSRALVWTPRLECRTVPAGARADAVDLLWDRRLRRWTVSVNGTVHTCVVDPVMPEQVEHRVRRCLAGMVRACAVDWSNADVRRRCEAYTAVVYNGGTTYRNAHCAMCNAVPTQVLQCVQMQTVFKAVNDFGSAAFSVLLDLGLGRIRACPQRWQLYDPFYKRCRAVLCPHLSSHESSDSCVPSPPHPEVMIYSYNANNASAVRLNSCRRFALEPDAFLLGPGNNSAWVPEYGINFSAGHFHVTPDGELEICADDLGTEFVDKFSPSMGIVTAAGLGVSVFFLLIHLLAVALVPELRNLSGKNLASLCVALLIAYTSFVIGRVLGRAAGMACIVTAVITFYSFLAAFAWMLLLAFDVWRSLRLASRALRVSSGRQWRRFAAYSACAWLWPAAVVAAALFVESAGPGTVDDRLRPGFGVLSCWFARRWALLAFFAGPLAIVMVLNVIFFASAAVMVAATAPAGTSSGAAGARRDFRMYIRLALMMGLTWAVGLVAGALDNEMVWYAFVALNTLQGLFIFLAFTCTEKVVRGLGSSLPCAHRLRRRLSISAGKSANFRPPSFSWSGGSTDSARKSALGSSSESTTIGPAVISTATRFRADGRAGLY